MHSNSEKYMRTLLSFSLSLRRCLRVVSVEMMKKLPLRPSFLNSLLFSSLRLYPEKKVLCSDRAVKIWAPNLAFGTAEEHLFYGGFKGLTGEL